MSRCHYIGDLFEVEPEQYGLRGDTYLWMEMHEHFSEIPRPTTTSELEDQVAQAFLLLTGLPMSTPESFRVERFAHGEISSGFVSPGFWRGRAMALIKKRYAESQ